MTFVNYSFRTSSWFKLKFTTVFTTQKIMLSDFFLVWTLLLECHHMLTRDHVECSGLYNNLHGMSWSRRVSSGNND
jgi:hypothetical protein